MGKPALNLTKLNKRFATVQAVRDLTLAVQTAEIYTLIGPNGAGKTTTIKMITGLLAPTSGSIQVLGLDIAKDPVKVKHQIGYIPDDPFVYDYLSGREFLQLSGDLFGFSRKETNQRIEKLIEVYSISGIIDGLFSDYSRGNKQKTIIIATMLHDPKLLVIDEPILGLDVQSQKVTKQLFLDFVKKGGSIFLCTHTLAVAQELADRIGIIKEGKLIAEGTLSQLRSKAKKDKANLEDLFLTITDKKQ